MRRLSPSETWPENAAYLQTEGGSETPLTVDTPEDCLEAARDLARHFPPTLDDPVEAPPGRARISWPEIQVARVKEALRWPALYLQDDGDGRKALQLWSWCIAKNEAWSRFGAAAFGSRGASNRRLDRALRVICAGLIRDRALP